MRSREIGATALRPKALHPRKYGSPLSKVLSEYFNMPAGLFI